MQHHSDRVAVRHPFRALGPAPAAAALLLGCLAACSSAAPRDVPRFTPQQLYETTAHRGASFTADGTRVLVSSDRTGVFNVWALPLDGGAPQALTESTTDACMLVDAFPDDERMLYQSDRGGNEITHLWVRENDGTVRDLTPGEAVKAQFVGWSGDRNRFFVLTNERDPKFFDLWRYNTQDYARERVFENRDGFEIGDVSRDGRWVAMARVNTNEDSDIFVFDTTQPDEPPRNITPHDAPISHEVATFTPDSKALLFLTDAGDEFVHVRSFVLDGLPAGERNHQVVLHEPWDVMGVQFSRDGRYRVAAVNADACTQLQVLDTASGDAVELPADAAAVAFSRDGGRIAFYTENDTAPADMHVLDVESDAQRTLTNSLNPAIRAADLVEAEVVRYPSFDGLQIPALLYRPHAASANQRAPALVWVHGGPGGQSRRGYSANIQLLVNHGYAVLAVNNRGSSGYGKTFFHADDRKHGEVDLQDCVHARRWLADLDWVDGKRIGIAGGSYGGYMVVAALAFAPEEFACGLDIFGVTNWVRTLTSIPPWWASFRDSLYAEMGDPATDGERLRRISPLFHADRIKRPLLVIQGANDPRVLKVESDEIVAALRAGGVPVEYVVLDDEGHGFRGKQNRITVADAQLAFLDKHLRHAP